MPRKPKSKATTVREDTVQAYRVRETLSAAVLKGTVVSAAEFKANCLALMDDVHDNGAEFIITKHSQPVARLVPILDEAERKFIGRGAGLISVTGDVIGPTAPDWEEGADI